jgi:hypothetical protein
MLDHGGVQHWLVSVWTYGSVEVQFGMMSKQPPFADEAKRLELLRRLNGIAGIALPADGITRRPTFRLSVLVAEPALKAFLDVLEWVVQEDKTASV